MRLEAFTVTPSCHIQRNFTGSHLAFEKFFELFLCFSLAFPWIDRRKFSSQRPDTLKVSMATKV